MRFGWFIAAFLAGTLSAIIAIVAAVPIILKNPAVEEAIRSLSQPPLVNEMAARETIRETWEPVGSYLTSSALRQAAQPVGKIQINYDNRGEVGVCTGSIVDRFTILTAYHCIQPPVSSPSATVSSIQIVFGYLNSSDPLERHVDGKLRVFSLDHEFFIDGSKPEDSPADFILLQTKGNYISDDNQTEIDPSELWGTVPISPLLLSPSEGVRPLVAIHHPRKRLPLQISRYSCHTSGKRKNPNDLKESFGHSCATEEGSSGAPIFSLDTLQLVGIHRGAILGASTARLDSGVLPNFNVFSSVHDMLKESLSDEVATASGVFAEIVLRQHADELGSLFSESVLQKVRYREASEYIASVDSQVANLSFNVPRAFATERLGQVHVGTPGAAFFSCNALYLDGGYIVAPYHCTAARNASRNVGQFRFTGFNDLRFSRGAERELLGFPIALNDPLLSSEQEDFAVYEVPELGQLVSEFVQDHDDVFSPLVIRETPLIADEQGALIYLNSSNSITRHDCIILSPSEVSDLSPEVAVADNVGDEASAVYRCDGTTAGGSSGGVVIDQEGVVLAMHMYAFSPDSVELANGGLRLGLIVESLREAGIRVETM